MYCLRLHRMLGECRERAHNCGAGAHRIPATMPLAPAPMHTIFIGLYSSIENPPNASSVGTPAPAGAVELRSWLIRLSMAVNEPRRRGERQIYASFPGGYRRVKTDSGVLARLALRASPQRTARGNQ